MILVTLLLKFFLGLMFLLYKLVFAVFAGAVSIVFSIIAGLLGSRKQYHSTDSSIRDKSNIVQRKPFLTDEEILAAGLYPQDEGYEMSIISRILDK